MSTRAFFTPESARLVSLMYPLVSLPSSRNAAIILLSYSVRFFSISPMMLVRSASSRWLTS